MNKEIFLVFCGGEYDNYFHSAYSTLDKAEWAAMLLGGSVQTENLDLVFDLPKDKLFWRAVVGPQDIFVKLGAADVDFGNDERIYIEIEQRRQNGNVRFNLWAADEIEAKEICKEKREKIKAAGKWPKNHAEADYHNLEIEI